MPRGLPTDAVPQGRTRVYLALVRRHEAGQRTVIDDLAADVGVCRTTVYRHLLALRDDGLVTWEPDRAGTMRPTLRVVAHGTNKAR